MRDEMTVIKSSRIVTPDGVRDGGVIVRGGRIAEVVDAKRAATLDAEDCGDLAIMPGLVDVHVHVNEPGRTEWEGFETATRAAAAGGVTTLVDMPLNASPVTTSADAFNKKLAATEGQLHVNCGFWGGIVPGNGQEIEKLIDKGVLGFKAFLTH